MLGSESLHQLTTREQELGSFHSETKGTHQIYQNPIKIHDNILKTDQQNITKIQRNLHTLRFKEASLESPEPQAGQAPPIPPPLLVGGEKDPMG